MSVFNENYWTSRYQQGQTQWDAGAITTPLKTYFDQLEDRSLRILIPGGGSGWEAEYLHRQGFTQVYLLDLSAIPLQKFQERNPDFPAQHLLQADFFALEGQWDLIVEQTFFCALHPSQRPAYARQAARLLKPGGKLVGVLFNVPLNSEHPPFGGEEQEYRAYFEPHFSHVSISSCYNSIKPRAGREVWIRMVR
ncbi:methyltransferase domain-containing protein [Cesiribacter andamanensis]|uniref:Thiopurine S-methyltransferase n=1 Tax=Cesiribacter andamanensis AMV16 TaxID=1279009 RepID=M7NK11_9BACT|nr:methyltransferase domain-containing protein [Cesiribacter andamanensis]EMR02120.1 thiopurine S-methyltransferase [Cesiribacter andamanensis AMV16]